MLAIVQRGGATREKPPEVVRRYASRLPWAWDGLCFAVPFNDSTMDAARDLVTNAAPSAVTGLTWSRDDHGNPAAHLDAASYIDYPDNPAHNKPSTEITAYVRLQKAGTGDLSGGIFLKRYSASDPFVTWCIQHADSGADAAAANLVVGGAQNYWEAIGSAIPSTQWVSIFLRWRSGSAPVLDILGERGQVLATNFLASGVTGPLDYIVGQPIRINGMQDQTLNYYADYSQVMLWSRRLTDTEIQALVSDPYGWYSPRRTTVLVSEYPLVLGGGEMRGGGGMGGLY